MTTREKTRVGICMVLITIPSFVAGYFAHKDSVRQQLPRSPTMSIDLERIKASIADNMAGRKAAQTVFQLAKEEAKHLPTGKARDRFWEVLSNTIQEKLPKASKPSDDMTELEARTFGRQRIDFGKYEDERIDDIPMDYLRWLADAKDEFREELRRYLRSRRLKIESQDEEDDE